MKKKKHILLLAMFVVLIPLTLFGCGAPSKGIKAKELDYEHWGYHAYYLELTVPMDMAHLDTKKTIIKDLDSGYYGMTIEQPYPTLMRGDIIRVYFVPRSGFSGDKISGTYEAVYEFLFTGHDYQSVTLTYTLKAG